MDFSGLVGKFPINRSLSGDDYKYHLQQKRRLDMAPHDMLAVIKDELDIPRVSGQMVRISWVYCVVCGYRFSNIFFPVRLDDG